MPFSGRWPRSGMTRNGTAYKLPTLARRISGTGSSFWGTWPTPAASVPNDGEDPATWLERRERVKKTARNGNGMGTPLSIAVQLWPTPRAASGMTSPFRDPSKIKDVSRLVDRVAVYQTPTVNGNHNRKGLSAKSGDGLATFVQRSDSPNGESTQPRYLNPEWVEWLQGFPIGWTDLEGSETPSSLKSPNSGGE